MAAMALCNLASNLQNQPKMIAAGILEPVVGEATLALDAKSKSDFECVRYCLLILANLAVCQTNHPFQHMVGVARLPSCRVRYDVVGCCPRRDSAPHHACYGM